MYASGIVRTFFAGAACAMSAAAQAQDATSFYMSPAIEKSYSYDDMLSTAFDPNPINISYFKTIMMANMMNCFPLPQDDFGYDSGNVQWDCSVDFSQAGLYLVNHVQKIRQKKHMGEYRPLIELPDVNVYRFTG